jgi:glycosyltransferase involved in cell wall biosynthesis
LRVLISAYACAPDRGSEPGVGWNVASEVARYHDVWVLTSRENERAVLRELDGSSGAHPRFVFIGPGRWTPSKRVRRKRVPWLANVHYYVWQVAAYVVARRLHRRVQFDVVHHVTFVRYYSPSLVSLLPVPFVWGPVGGAERAPSSFWRTFGARGLAYEATRSVARRVGEHDPLVRLTARRSTIARVTTAQTATRVRTLGGGVVEVVPQVGLSRADLQRVRPGSDEDDDVRGPLVSVSRLLHWKGLDLAIRAFAAAGIDHVEYHIAGTGPERARLESLARRLGVGERVRFLGEVRRDDVFDLLSSALALVHPSLHDSGGNACLEAMAMRTPVICLDLGGPPLLVTGAAGVVIPAAAPRPAVSGLARAMRTLVDDPGLARELGERARARAETFSWTERGRQISETYERVAGAAR